MVAELNLPRLDEEGQSVLEFLLMVPAMLAMTLLVIRINTVIQMGIVNQQYSREQLFILSGNHPVYPRLDRREFLAKTGLNRLTLGVAEEQVAADTGAYTASTFYIHRRPGLGSEENGEEVKERANVRVRNTVTICTPVYTLDPGGGPDKQIFRPGAEWSLRDSVPSPKFPFCDGKKGSFL